MPYALCHIPPPHSPYLLRQLLLLQHLHVGSELEDFQLGRPHDRPKALRGMLSCVDCKKPSGDLKWNESPGQISRGH
jgi:hypothetical protein